ncbi:MAG: site-specific integrase [Actinobacteria bacterium]|nr:site-specific integrase [Actinomycetota bacterium]
MGWINKNEKSGSYIAGYRDPLGKQRSKSFRTKAEAKAFLASVESSKQRGDWTDPRRGKVKFGEFAAKWLGTTVHLKPSTRTSYELLLRLHVLPYFEDAPLGQIERVHIQAWIADLMKKGAGAGTVRNAYRMLARVLGEAESSRMITRNPATKIPLPKSERQEMHVLTPEEIDRLADTVYPRYRALILMAGFTGLRWGELAGLKVEHLDLLRGVVHVKQSLTEAGGGRVEIVPTKTGEHRTVPLPKFLCKVLAEQLSLYPSKERWVFSPRDGGPMRHSNFLSRHFKPALIAAGLNGKVRIHDLRHSAASIAIASGANVKQVQQMLGHASATVTLDTYSHVFPSLAEQLRQKMNDAYETRDSATGTIGRARGQAE